MADLRIRHMNFTLREMEIEQARKDAAWYASLPAEVKADRSHYWWIERNARRKKKGKAQWFFVAEFYGTKRGAADHFLKFFKNRTDHTFGLRHILGY